MTDEELQAIKARAERALPGPWELRHTKSLMPEVYPVGGERAICDFSESSYRHHPDADFIAHARTDIPALLAEVECLKAALIDAGGSVECAPGLCECYDED